METKKTKIIGIVALVALALTVVTATYAYFQAQVGDPAAVDISVNANTVDTFSFSTGYPISFSLNQDNFGTGNGNQTATTTASAKLTANNKTNSATEYYYLYLNIKSNTFAYSQDNTKPEILLKITNGNNVEVKPTLDVEYKITTDGKGNSISGYDITTYNDVLTIYENKEITTTSSTTDTWNITITFVNYNFDQSDNAGKSLSASLLIQKSELQFALGDVTGDGSIDTNDVTKFMNYFNNNSLFNKYALAAADVNGDGTVNEIDYDILNYYNSNTGVVLPYQNTDTYNITYNLNEGTAAVYLRTKYSSNFEASLDFSKDVFAKVKKDGYGFTGWTGSNGDTAEEEVTIAKGTTGDLSYTANWALLGDVNQDGCIDTSDKLKYNFYLLNQISLKKDVADVNRDGVVDYLDLDNILPYVVKKIKSISYIPDKIYNITYDLDGGKFLNAFGNEYNARDKYSELTSTTELDTPTKEGYTFLGWTGSNGNTPETYVEIYGNKTSDLHFKANWQAN